MWLVADESMDVINEVVKVFQSHNSAWSLTRVMFSDKDFTERKNFRGFSKCKFEDMLISCNESYQKGSYN